jgi:hypothetical protein
VKSSKAKRAGMSREREAEPECDLKKQSQFVEGQMNVNVLQRKDYENRPRSAAPGKPSQTKPISDGRPAHWPDLPKNGLTDSYGRGN